MTTNPLGTLQAVNIRDIWQGEASHFTPWLALPANLETLGETLAMSLEPVGTETPVGPFFADIVCRNLNDSSTVLIENQLERTDHRHLGQIFTYAAGLDAVTIIWISPQFTEEHRAAIDWLNRITLDNFSFFAVEIELWKIGDSPPAPKFNIVAKPNDWTRAIRRKRPAAIGNDDENESSELGLQKLAFWEGFKNYLATVGSPVRCQTPSHHHWIWHSIGRSGVALCSVILSASKRTANTQLVRANLVIHDDFSGERMQKLQALEPAFAAATREAVHFEINSNTNNRSKLFVQRQGNWSDPAMAAELYAWLDEKHRAILSVIKPHLTTI